MTDYHVSAGSFWRSFGEVTVVFHQTPDDSRQFVCHGDHRVTVAFVGMTFEDTIEIMMLFADRDGRHVHRPAQQRRAAFADG